MVIVRFSMDRTRWDSLKLTTRLNFLSDSKQGGFTDNDVELDSPAAEYPMPPTPSYQHGGGGSPAVGFKDAARLTLAGRIRSPGGGALGSIESFGMFESKSSLHESFV